MFSSDPGLLSNQIPISLDFPSEPQELNLFVQMMIKRIANATNTKESGLYIPLETATFISYFTPGNPQKLRNVYRKVFDMVSLNGGNIGAGATVTFPHNIVGIVSCTHIYGTATTTDAPVRYISLPYVSQVAAQNVQIYLTATDVVLVNGASTLTQAYITAEFLKT